MNESDLEFLQSDLGTEWFLKLNQRTEDAASSVRWLRKSLDQNQAAALVELSRARKALAKKHSLASSLFLDTLAASQASSEALARWHAARFEAGAQVFDLCCGAGIDTLALAKEHRVCAIDRDPSRLSFARANAHVANLEVEFVRAEVPQCLGTFDFAFCDPDRRVNGKRVTDPEMACPSLSQLLASSANEGIGVKLSPMADLALLEGYGELEFISFGGELKEIVLWTGSLNRAPRSLSLPEQDLHLVGSLDGGLEVSESLGGYFYDPDPALIRSGFLAGLAAQLGLRAVAPQIAYLTSTEPVEHDLFRRFAVADWDETGGRKLQKLLERNNIGRLDIARRGHPESPEDVRKRIRLKGDRTGQLFLTRLADRRIAILATRES